MGLFIAGKYAEEEVANYAGLKLGHACVINNVSARRAISCISIRTGVEDKLGFQLWAKGRQACQHKNATAIAAHQGGGLQNTAEEGDFAHAFKVSATTGAVQTNKLESGPHL